MVHVFGIMLSQNVLWITELVLFVILLYTVYMIKEDEVIALLDEKGQISNVEINTYLASKNIISLDKYGSIMLKLTKEGKAPYFEYKNKILNIVKNHNYKNKGNMGVQPTNVDVQKTDDITEEIIANW